MFFSYIIGHKENNKGFTLQSEEKDLYVLVNNLIKLEPEVSRALDSYNAVLYNSIDVNSRIGDENDLVTKENNETSNMNMTKDIVEDILEPFESKIEYLINSDEEYAFFNSLKFQNYGSKKKIKRFCYFCLLKKPDRTHHCRTCRKCFRKMDHHCHFLTTCIAYGNYKFFLLLLFYALLTLNFMIFTSFETMRFYLNEYGDNVYLTVYISFFVLMCILDVIMIYFFGLHL